MGEPICKGCSCRLINNVFAIKSCNSTCINGCLLLRIIEIGGDCHNCICDFFASKFFGKELDFFEDFGWDLLRVKPCNKIFPFDLDLWPVLAIVDYNEGPILPVFCEPFITEISSNHSLSVVDCVGCQSSCLVVSLDANNHFLIGFESHTGRSRGHSFIILQNLDPPFRPEAHTCICRTQIYAYPRLCQLLLNHSLTFFNQ